MQFARRQEILNDGPVHKLKGYWSAVHVREGEAWKTCMLTIIQTPKPPATGDGTRSLETTPSDKNSILYSRERCKLNPLSKNTTPWLVISRPF
jgi:hypothetical protein